MQNKKTIGLLSQNENWLRTHGYQSLHLEYLFIIQHINSNVNSKIKEAWNLTINKYFATLLSRERELLELGMYITGIDDSVFWFFLLGFPCIQIVRYFWFKKHPQGYFMLSETSRYFKLNTPKQTRTYLNSYGVIIIRYNFARKFIKSLECYQ